MGINNKNIIKTRAHIKNKILNDHKIIGYENERKQIFSLLKRTIDTGESNSLLLIGPRGVGKTTLTNDVVRELQASKHFNSIAVLVRLHGLIHTDDRLALKGITSQMNLDNAVDGKVFGSFAENLAFLLACLRTGQKETAKSVIFVLEDFDLFCAHHNQTLLYNLLDVSQSAQTPICVLGVTCRLDVIELFEKRVKSRFSHRQIFLFPNQDDGDEIDIRINRIRSLLLLPDKEFLLSYTVQWNKSVKTLTNDKKFRLLMQRLLDIDSGEATLKNMILVITSKLSDEKSKITVEDFEEQLNDFEKDDLIRIIQDLSILELCLIIAMKHHVDIYDAEPFNFEMILTRYSKFVNSNSGIQGVQRAVVLKAFEHIQNMELVARVSTSGSRLQKEYQLFKLLATTLQINEAVQKLLGIPTEVVQWAKSSLTL